MDLAITTSLISLKIKKVGSAHMVNIDRMKRLLSEEDLLACLLPQSSFKRGLWCSMMSCLLSPFVCCFFMVHREGHTISQLPSSIQSVLLLGKRFVWLKQWPLRACRSGGSKKNQEQPIKIQDWNLHLSQKRWEESCPKLLSRTW